MNLDINIKDVYNSSPEILAKQCTNGKIIFRPFQNFISEKIVEEIEKGNGRLIIEVPPQHGKSEVCSRWIPVWFLSNFPNRHIILLSYNDTQAEKWGRITRNTIKKNNHILKVYLSQDSTAKDCWHTSEEGSMICSGAEGNITGNPGHLIIIDDAFKSWAEAMNENKRKKVIDWYVNTVTQRFQEDTTVIIVNTRYHEDDLSGHLSKFGVDEWCVLRLPAIAEENDLIGRKVGEPLMKGKGIKFLEKRKQEMGAMSFSAVYQQSPQAQDGNIFKRKYWQRYLPSAKPESFSHIIQSWDTALEKGKENAYSVCTTWGASTCSATKTERFYLLGIWREKAEYPTIKRKMAELWRLEKADLILLENKSTGAPLRQELTDAGFPIMEVNPCADKITRAWSVIPIFETGRVFLAEGESWADDIVAGCASYPAGTWTDCVDTISQALSWLRQPSGALGADNINNLLIPAPRQMFRFGTARAKTARPRPHWYRGR